MGVRNPKHSKRRIATKEKRLRALELRKAGYDYQTIAKMSGYASKGAAFNAVDQALKEMMQEPADEVRKLELARLDAIQTQLWTAVETPTPPPERGEHDSAEDYQKARHSWEMTRLQAFDRLDRLMKRRASLLGLDAPVKKTHEVSGSGGGPIQKETRLVDMTKLSPDQIDRIISGTADLEGKDPEDDPGVNGP